MKSNHIIIILSLALIIIVGSLIGKGVVVSKMEHTTHTDTLYIRDTIHIDHFREVTKKVVDTAYFAITDTISINDTVYLPLPREIKVYEDSLFKAQVSGIQPNLDWAEVYPQTKIVTEYIEVKKRKPWGIGVSVGYGFGLQNNVVYTTPYIGVGVTYDIFSW